MRLDGQIIPIEALTIADRRSMLAVMQRHYACVSPDRFAVDLNEKHWVIVLRERLSGEICGFSTQMMMDATVNGRTVRALFSGDTIVDREQWGDPALSHLWGGLALSLIENSGDAELYWLLISKGFRTYRFLPLFFHEYFPRHDRPQPADSKQVLDALGRAKFGRLYDPASGIVRASTSAYRLRDDLAGISAHRLNDPVVRFFLHSNPGYVNGDELCCLARLSRENFTAAAWRVIGAEPATISEAACRLRGG